MSTAEKLRAEGRAEGRAEILLRQIRTRFGSVPEEVERRLRGASLEELDRCAERVLVAESPEEVVGEGR